MNIKKQFKIESILKEADQLMINKITKYENIIAQLKKELQEVKDDNRKLSLQINDMIAKLRDAQF
jgi:septal ring factor EnvC (AmiA/AmiB activator)